MTQGRKRKKLPATRKTRRRKRHKREARKRNKSQPEQTKNPKTQEGEERQKKDEGAPAGSVSRFVGNGSIVKYRQKPIGKASKLSAEMDKWITDTVCNEVTISDLHHCGKHLVEFACRPEHFF